MVTTYAKLLARYPLALLVCTILVCLGCILSVVLITDLPDFSNPIKGFETRGTEISQRSLALRNLRADLDHLRGQNTVFYRYPDEYQVAQNFSRNRKKLGNSKPPSHEISNAESTTMNGNDQLSKRVTRSQDDTENNKTVHNKKNKKFKMHEADPRKPLAYCNTTPGQSSFGQNYAILAFEPTGGSDLFSTSVFNDLCDAEQRLWSAAAKAVQGLDDDDVTMSHFLPPDSCQMATKRRCCQPWHLASITAHLFDKTDCTQLNESDIQSMKSRIDYCRKYESTLARCWNVGELECLKSVPANCSGQAMNLLYQYILSKDFDKPATSWITLMILPVSKDAYKDLTLTQIERLPDFVSGKNIHLVAIDLGVRDIVFEQYLLKDMIFGVLSLTLVFFAMWIYSASFIFTLAVIIGIHLSLALAYFVYRLVFGIEFFPFMNLLTYVLIVGVGADDAFIFHSAWTKAKFDKNSGTHAKILSDTLSHAAVSMFVTSLTTAAAFYTNIFSHIIVVKCFGIFAGTTILTNYLLVITWLPACVVLSEKRPIFSTSYCWCCPRWCIRQQRTHSTHEPERIAADKCIRRHSANVANEINAIPGDMEDDHKRNIDDKHDAVGRRKLSQWNGRKLCSILTDPIQRLYQQMSIIGRVFFQKLLPWLVIKLRPFWLLALGIIAILSAVAVFYKPALKLPSKDYFQYFDPSHPFERWENDVKKRFRFSSDNVRIPLIMYIVWGIMPTTDARIFDPDDMGTLRVTHTYPENEEIDLFDNVDLLWLRDFCSSVAVQNFTRFQPSEMPMMASCFVEDFMTTIRQRPCSHPVTKQSQRPCCADVSFPYPSGMFEVCLREFVTLARSTITLFDLTSGLGPSGPLFSAASGRPSGLVVMFTSRYNFSFSYSQMKEFYESSNTWVQDRLKAGPMAVRNGWFIADHLQLFDLQQALASGTRLSVVIAVVIAFAVLFVTTCNPLISFLAILSISAVIVSTIAVLILLDWELNVLESTIIILTIGLSFDFTLHYGVAYRLCPTADDPETRVIYALGEVGSPVFMAFITTFLAGAAMLPSTTLAYFQIGLFMMLETSISWLYATFFFTSLLHCVGPSGNTCQLNLRTFCTKRALASGNSSISGTGRRVSRDIATEAALAAAARRKKSSIVSFNAVAFNTLSCQAPMSLKSGVPKMNVLTPLDYNRLDTRRSISDYSNDQPRINEFGRHDSPIEEESPSPPLEDHSPIENRAQDIPEDTAANLSNESDERERLRRDSDETPPMTSEEPSIMKKQPKKPSLKERLLHRFSLKRPANNQPCVAVEMEETEQSKLYRRNSDTDQKLMTNRQSHQDVPFIDRDSSAHTMSLGTQHKESLDSS